MMNPNGSIEIEIGIEIGIEASHLFDFDGNTDFDFVKITIR